MRVTWEAGWECVWQDRIRSSTGGNCWRRAHVAEFLVHQLRRMMVMMMMLLVLLARMLRIVLGVTIEIVGGICG